MKRITIGTAVIVATLLSGDASYPQSPSSASSLESMLSSVRAKHGLPAMAAAVVTSDRTLDIAVTGVPRLGFPGVVLRSDRFHLGSLTKGMTATLMAYLVEDRRLSWSSTPLDIFPELSATIHPELRRITLTQLLSHRAGLPPFSDFEEYRRLPTWRGTTAQQRADFTLWLLAQPPQVRPGQFLYSNAGYAVAAAMAERVTGESWESLMRRRVFEPLRMEATFGWPARKDPRQPWGHWSWGDSVGNDWPWGDWAWGTWDWGWWDRRWWNWGNWDWTDWVEDWVEDWVKDFWDGLARPPLSPHSPSARYQLPPFIAPASDISIAIDDYVRFLQFHLRGCKDASLFSAKKPLGGYTRRIKDTRWDGLS